VKLDIRRWCFCFESGDWRVAPNTRTVDNPVCTMRVVFGYKREIALSDSSPGALNNVGDPVPICIQYHLEFTRKRVREGNKGALIVQCALNVRLEHPCLDHFPVY